MIDSLGSFGPTRGTFMIIGTVTHDLQTRKMLLISPAWMRSPTTKPSISVPGFSRSRNFIAQTPRSIRSASQSGRPACWIFRAAAKLSYGTRKNVIASAVVSKIA